MRKLASIQYVHDITPIKNADRIELVHVLGWQVVCKKGEFHAGDHAVYFEIDSFLPMDERYSFLKNSSYKKSDILGEGYKLRTVTLRGELSQGLLLPLSDFPEITTDELGTDVTELLHVRKWDIEERATDSGTIIGSLPNGVPKTDETRVQVAPELIRELGNQPYYITTKMDGSSHSISIDDEGNFHVAGHSYEYADDGKSSFYDLVKKNGFEQKLRAYLADHHFSSMTVQGEFCAPKIQGNPVKLKTPHWFVFTAIADWKRLGMKETKDVCKALDAEMVPVTETGDHFDEKYPTVEDVLARADREMYRIGMEKVKAEGIVVRPVEPVYSDLVCGYLSMKAVSNKYLLKKAKKDDTKNPA